MSTRTSRTCWLSLRRSRLARSLFPLGDSQKGAVRAEAAERGLLVADKPDSHDICFIADGDTQGFLATHLGTRHGHIVDRDGAVLGEHEGTHAFTVGQRKGLGVTVATDDRAPRYVLSIEPAANTVTVGPREALQVYEIVAERPRWCGPEVADGTAVSLQYRAHGEVVPGRVRIGDGRIVATLRDPAVGVAPGQTLALYDHTRVLGSATITAAS